MPLSVALIVMMSVVASQSGATGPDRIEGALTYDQSEERRNLPVKVSYNQDVELVGHVERRVGKEFVLLGRIIRPRELGGVATDYDFITPGTLVKVKGRALAEGAVLADTVEVINLVDPQRIARLERASGKFKEKFFKKVKLLEESGPLDYLEEMAVRLLPGHLPEEARKFDIKIVLDPIPNAFVLPDHTVVINSGMITVLENESQLASVLAHELVHATQLHAARSLDKEQAHRLISLGSLIAQIALGTSKDSGNRDAAKGIGLMSSAYLSGYSRAHEDEADLVGLRYLFLAGYDVREAPKVWETFRRLYGDVDPQLNFFYGSHSTAAQRRDHLASEIWRSYEPSGMTGGRTAHVEYLQKMAPVFKADARLQMQNGNLHTAETRLRRSLEGDPEDPQTYRLLGDLNSRFEGRQRLAEAVEAYRQAVRLDPDSLIAHRRLAGILDKLGMKEEARVHHDRAEALAESLKKSGAPEQEEDDLGPNSP